MPFLSIEAEKMHHAILNLAKDLQPPELLKYSNANGIDRFVDLPFLSGLLELTVLVAYF